ncbi:hypothetical protein TCSYLVIO_007142 [Trypanosoma cruzi]|nr:hypothetical protein TCSYLVIO_007142 [Trypanosoma cruzi]
MPLVAILCLSGQRLGERSPEIFCKGISDLPKCCRSRFDRRCFHARSTLPPPPHPRLRRIRYCRGGQQQSPAFSSSPFICRGKSILWLLLGHRLSAEEAEAVLIVAGKDIRRLQKGHTLENKFRRAPWPRGGGCRHLATKRRLFFLLSEAKKWSKAPQHARPPPLQRPSARACVSVCVLHARWAGRPAPQTPVLSLLPGETELRTDVHGKRQKERHKPRRNKKRTVSPTAAKHTRTRTLMPLRPTFLFPFNRCPAPDLPTHSLPSSASPASSSQAA